MNLPTVFALANRFASISTQLNAAFQPARKKIEPQIIEVIIMILTLCIFETNIKMGLEIIIKHSIFS